MLTIEGLRVVYRGLAPVVRDLDMRVPDGSVISLLGANGAGKTTVMRAVGGLLPAHGGRITAGRVTFDGHDITRATPSRIVRLGLGQVMEGRRIFAQLTVEENLRVGGHTRRGRGSESNRDRVYEMFPPLAERRNDRAGYLSGGEQQMLAMGRALMPGPRLILLDEPSLGLAPLMVERIGDIIAAVNAEGTSILLVEQNAGMALRVASYAYALSHGRCGLEGPAAELAVNPAVVNSYLGGESPAAARPRAAAVAVPRSPEEPPERPVLTVRGLSLRFAGLRALQDVGFDLSEDETLAVIGPNGAGKTSLFNCLTGVYRPQDGSITYRGSEVTGLKASEIAARGIRRTFQNVVLFNKLDVLENLMLGRHAHIRAGALASAIRTPSSVREEALNRERCRETARLLAVDKVLGRNVGTLPYGVQKRVEVARALCAEPGLLLLDEPVAGMNEAESEDMADRLRAVRHTLRIPMIVVEHDMQLVNNLADRVLVLDFGKPLATGTPSEIQRHPEVRRAYLGDLAPAAAGGPA